METPATVTQSCRLCTSAGHSARRSWHTVVSQDARRTCSPAWLTCSTASPTRKGRWESYRPRSSSHGYAKKMVRHKTRFTLHLSYSEVKGASFKIVKKRRMKMTCSGNNNVLQHAWDRLLLEQLSAAVSNPADSHIQERKPLGSGSTSCILLYSSQNCSVSYFALPLQIIQTCFHLITMQACEQ